MSVDVREIVVHDRATVGLSRTRPRLGVPGLLLGLFGTVWGGVGCGVAPEPVRLDAVFDRTGTLRSDGVFFPMTVQNVVTVGDQADNLAVRGFVSVNLSAIPAGANVTKVVLHVRGTAPFGNPFGDFVTLSVDHVNVVSGIDSTDFLGGFITTSIATVPPLPVNSPGQDVELDVTNEVNTDRAAGRPISSFRFLFAQAPTVDTQTDAVFIDASPTDPAMQPFALVTFGR